MPIRLAALLCVLVSALTLSLSAQEDEQPTPAAPADAPQTVLVAGATGSIGKFVVRELLERGHAVRGLTRRPDFGREQEPRVDWRVGDLRDRESLTDVVEGVDSIIFVAGSKSWSDPTNTPELVDYGGVAALADLGVQSGVRHFVLLSSVGTVNKMSGISEHLTNVLKWKAKAEVHLRASGLAYTIMRPLGMWDRPGRELGIALMQGDTVRATVTISREGLARVAVESVFNEAARNKSFELFNAAAFDVDGWKQDLAKLAVDA